MAADVQGALPLAFDVPIADYALALLLTLVALWLALVLALVIMRPRGLRPSEAAVLLPDIVRLVGGLARDRSLPRRVRVRLWLLLAFMASPIDLIPDVIPIVGVVDDVILAYIVLRSVVRTAGDDILARHWPGTRSGLNAVRQLVGLHADCR